MATDVSMCQTQQFCGWDIAYKRLGPPETIHIMDYLQEPRRQRISIFASSTYGIRRHHPQELLQKHQDVITPEYQQIPCIIISGDLHCMPQDRIESPCWKDSSVLQDSTGLRYSMPFLSQSASQRTPLSQMQSIHYSAQRTHRTISHR